MRRLLAASFALIFIAGAALAEPPLATPPAAAGAAAQLTDQQALDLAGKASRGDTLALTTLKTEVTKKYAAAEFGLGVYFYFTNKPADAAQWFQKAADLDSPSGEYFLGLLYSNGKGVAQDPAKAAALYQRAAEHGIAKAQLALGLAYDTGTGVPQDYSKAVVWLQEAAKQGEPSAQAALGSHYVDGRGVPQDYAQALTWLQKAADQGDAEAENNLSSLYGGGRGVPQDNTKALYWADRAANGGNPTAAANLCGYYANPGASLDYVLAYRWCVIGRVLSGPKDPAHLRAQITIDSITLKMTDAEIAQAQNEAADWEQRFKARKHP